MINSETSRQLENRMNCGSVAKRLLSLIPAVSTVALMSGVTPVQAQAVIEEITITAQKRAESIQDVPISVTAFSGDFIENNGIDNIRDVALFTPNMNITTQNTIGNTQITIRGVGSPGNSGIEPSVAVFVDGVYLARAAAVLGSLSDIETFEVLRGPQGTLFGRNTPMGALNITTRAPTQELEGFLQLTAGNLEQRSVKGYVSGALSKTLSGRASFVMTDRQGYTKNLVVGKRTNEIEEYGGRVKLLWEPTEGFDATIIADYMKTNGSYGESEAFNFTGKYLDTIESSFGVRPTDDKFDHVTGDAFNFQPDG